MKNGKTLKRIVLIGDKNPFVLSFRRVFPCAFVDKSMADLASYLKSPDDSIVMLDSEKKEDIEKCLEVLRGELESLAPLIVFGYEPRQEFWEKNKAFYEKPQKYIYLRKPLNLFNFLNCLRNAQSLHSEEECRTDVFRYSNPLGRILEEVYTNLSHREFHYSISYLRKRAEQAKSPEDRDFRRNIEYMYDKIESIRQYLDNMIQQANECNVPSDYGTDKLRVKQMLSNLRNIFGEIARFLLGEEAPVRKKRLLDSLNEVEKEVGEVNNLRSELCGS